MSSIPSAMLNGQISHGLSGSFPFLRAARARPTPIAPEPPFTDASMRMTVIGVIPGPSQMSMPLVNVFLRIVELKMHQRGGAASPAWQDMRGFMQQSGGAAFPARMKIIL